MTAPTQTDHLIQDIRMRETEDQKWLLCTCGTRIEAGRSGDLYDLYADHRKTPTTTKARKRAA